MPTQSLVPVADEDVVAETDLAAAQDHAFAWAERVARLRGRAAGSSERGFEEAVDALPRRYVRLMARDDGWGTPADALPHVFEPFFTTRAPGTGLPSVAEFVKTARGGLRVESEEGEGTTFHL